MKNIRKLGFSIFSLFLALTVSVSSTYAWISLNNNASVENFYLEIGSNSDALVIGVEEYSTNNHSSEMKKTLTEAEYLLASESTKELYSLKNGIYKLKEELDSIDYSILSDKIRPLYSISNYSLNGNNSLKNSDEYLSLGDEDKLFYVNNEFKLKDSFNVDLYNLLNESEKQLFYSYSYVLNIDRVIDKENYQNLIDYEKDLYSVSEYKLESEIIDSLAFSALDENLKAYYVKVEGEQDLYRNILSKNISSANYLLLENKEKNFYVQSKFELLSEISAEQYNSLIFDETKTFFKSNTSENYSSILNDEINFDVFDNLTAIQQNLYNVKNYKIKAEISKSEYNNLSLVNQKYYSKIDDNSYLFNLSSLISFNEYEALNHNEKKLYEIKNYKLKNEITLDEYNYSSEIIKSNYNVSKYKITLTHFESITSLRNAYKGLKDLVGKKSDENATDFSGLFNITPTEIVYHTTLKIDDLINCVQFVDGNVTKDDNNVLSINLKHVTVNQETNSLETITEENAASYDYIDKIEAKSNVDYLSFRLFFRSSSLADSQKLYLYVGENNASQVIPYDTINHIDESHKVKAWKNIKASIFGQSADVNEQSLLNVRAANAVRIAFSSSDNKVNNIWDPNSTKGYIYNGSYETTDGNFIHCNLAEEWARAFKNDNSISVGTAVEGNVIATSSEKEINNATSLFSFDKNNAWSECDCFVSIWLEGTDSECFNAILGDIFSTRLKFVSIAG